MIKYKSFKNFMSPMVLSCGRIAPFITTNSKYIIASIDNDNVENQKELEILLNAFEAKEINEFIYLHWRRELRRRGLIL